MSDQRTPVEKDLAALYRACAEAGGPKDRASVCLMIDIQDRYTRGVPSTVERIRQAAPALRARMPLIWIYISRPETPPLRATGKNIAAVFNNLAGMPFEGHPFTAVFRPQAEDWMLSKRDRNAFENESLGPFLKRRKIETVYCAGFHEDVCVLDTALGAKWAGFQPVLLQDLTGPYHEGAGASTLQYYNGAGIPSMTSKELLLSPVR